MDDFPWNGKGAMKETYNKDNFVIEYTGAKTGRVIIFISGNGLYYPNEERIMYEKIVEQDYYEWINLAKHKRIRNYYEKLVFIRDIYKQWYITGINSRLDSVDRVREWLEKECEGYEITTCGSSAGGYMATVLGVQMNAKRIFTNSGQFSIEHTIPYREVYENDIERNKYFNIVYLLQEQSNHIYYFYPANVEQDRLQYEMVKNLPLKVFRFKSSEHGVTMESKVFPYLLTLSNEELNDYYSFFANSFILPCDFSKKIIPCKDRVMLFSRKVWRKKSKVIKEFFSIKK